MKSIKFKLLLSANSPDFQDTIALLKVEYIYGGSKEEESHRYVC